MSASMDSEATKEIKEMGAALISTMAQIPFYRMLSAVKLFGLPSKANVFMAAQELNGIAAPTKPAGDAAVENYKAAGLIGRLLNIQTSYS